MIKTAAIGAISNPAQSMGLGIFTDSVSVQVVGVSVIAFVGRYDPTMVHTARFDKAQNYLGRLDPELDFKGRS